MNTQNKNMFLYNITKFSNLIAGIICRNHSKKIVSFCKKSILGLTLSAIPISAGSALATNGFFSYCTGPFKCATGGAGAALSTSAVDALVNPSLLAKQANNWLVDLRLMHVSATMDTSLAPLGNKVGKQKSRLTDFPGFSSGISYKLENDLTLGIALGASGGMGTKYAYPRTMTMAQISPPFDQKIMYRLAHIAPTISGNVSESVSLGIAMEIGYADFKTDAAVPAGPQALAETKGRDKRQSSWGLGGRVGALWDSEIVSLGFSYASPVLFKKFSNYKDLLLGSVDTPMNFVVGSAFHINSDTDLLFDIKHIFYKQVKTLRKLPSEGGFGWSDQTVFMLGVTQRYGLLSASLGYNYGKSPIKKDRTFANGLLPAVLEQHFTAGLGYKVSDKIELLSSLYYAPKKSQTDSGDGDRFSKLGKGSKVSISQYGFQLGLKCNF